ncbi:hypothetical protein LSUE1_G000567 [Lachnellula suecica]|uniref:Uncharacterized protein n=1 Tax=Lachnellula suecica TaxID=602035 RepID=A0A8T9CHU9_9HELO|nr:hypothetical protein LSUE1_G000567 [Lachnellula suecica]
MSIPSATATSAAPSTVESATGGGISSNPQLTAAPVVGGVLGSIGFIAVVSLLFFFLRKRKRDRRHSLLTPLTTGNRSHFDVDGDEKWSSGGSSPLDKLKVAASGLKTGVIGIGASLKSKVGGDRIGGVNLNRGNSQFLDGTISQHSRNNSVLSNSSGKITVRDRFTDWWESFREKLKLGKNNEPADPFAAARGMNEKQANFDKPPDFSQLLGMDDRELQLQAERRRASLTKTQSGASLPPLGSLGLNFGDDPFADPITTKTTTQNPPRNNLNPFADPISQPQPSIPKQNTYVQDIRRSRGQSIDATQNGPAAYGRPPSTVALTSRYPSTIAPSRDSYRDTVFSSWSANGRKGKGRSDPFDLERPELWRNGGNVLSGNRASRTRGFSISGRESAALYPSPLTTNNLPPPRVVSTATPRVASIDTYGSKYSSGVSSFAGWGDPGPDLGPGSVNSSLRGNASSSGGSADFGSNGDWNRQQQLASQGDGNVSPVSFGSGVSSLNGVGKAM